MNIASLELSLHIEKNGGCPNYKILLCIAAHPCPLVGQIIPAVDDRRDPQQSLQVSAVLGGSCGSHCVARVVLASLLPFTGLLHRSAEHPGIVAMQENS